MDKVWSVEVTGSVWGTTTEGALLTIRPGNYALKEGGTGTYVLDLADDRIWIEAIRIEQYLRLGTLKIEGHWP